MTTEENRGGHPGEGRDLDKHLQTRLAVIDRLIDYWWDVDRDGAGRSASFYTQDCVYDMAGHVMKGPAAVQAYYAFRDSRGHRLVRHVLTNLRAIVHAPDRATVEGVLTVYATDGQPVQPTAPPILVADNTALFVREADGEWRMQHHRIAPLFRGGVPVLVPPAA